MAQEPQDQIHLAVAEVEDLPPINLRMVCKLLTTLNQMKMANSNKNKFSQEDLRRLEHTDQISKKLNLAKDLNQMKLSQGGGKLLI